MWCLPALSFPKQTKQRGDFYKHRRASSIFVVSFQSPHKGYPSFCPFCSYGFPYPFFLFRMCFLNWNSCQIMFSLCILLLSSLTSFIEGPFQKLKICEGIFQSLKASLFITHTMKSHWSEHMMYSYMNIFRLFEDNAYSIFMLASDHGMFWFLGKFTCFHWLWKESVTLCQILVHIAKKWFQ